MAATTITSDLVTGLGTYLGYGVIGLGLGVAVLSAILLTLKSDRALAAGTRFMMFGLALVVIGAGLELVKAYESSAKAEREFESSQNLPDEFWDDFLLSRQQKLFGTAEPTDESASGSVKNGEARILNIYVPQGECRFYFAAVRPPAKINVTVTDTDIQHRSLKDKEYYQTGRICTPRTKASQQVRLQAEVRNAGGQFSIAAFKAPPPPDETAPPSRVVKRVCTGEFEANCAGPHDAFFTCGYFGPDDEIAKNMCPGQPSRAVRIYTKGGNACGYSLIEVTCGS